MDLNFTFRNPAQKAFYYSTARNQCFSGAFNNGKSWCGCFKCLTLLLSFPNYRLMIARQIYKHLKVTTMQTFLKMCPSEMIASHNEQDGLTSFTNSSMIYWYHLDTVDEQSLRGLEINSYLVDQAEETSEKTMDILDARLGRWDGAIVPDEMLKANPDWPRDPYSNKPMVPSYGMLLVNPDTEFHFVYRKYHPDSPDRKKGYFYTEGQWDKTLGSLETYNEALTKDQEYVDKYVLGKWGRSSASIHHLRKECQIDFTPELLKKIKAKGNLFRSMDHGESAPTCCLWVAAIDGVYIFYREYYTPNKVISYHRQAIHDLSEGEEYSGDYADPSITDKWSQKKGGFWTIQDEYLTDDIVNDLGEKVPSIYWQPADNNEFATRNRINELLTPSLKYKNPITGETPAPGIYFIKKSPEYPNGCQFSITQIGSQRKKLIGTIEGKAFYSDEREENEADHAYDPIRYFVAMHGSQPKEAKKNPPKNTFAYYNMLLQMKQIRGNVPVAGSVGV